MATKEVSLQEMIDKRLDFLFEESQDKMVKLQALQAAIAEERRRRRRVAEIEAKKAEIAALEKGLQ